jgi:excisionase family DNA binding protein
VRADAIRETAAAVDACAQVMAASAKALEASARALRHVAESADPGGALTMTDAAAALGVSRGYLKKLIESGRLRAERHGPKVWRVPSDALARYRRTASGLSRIA